jgi:hypothetical protein
LRASRRRVKDGFEGHEPTTNRGGISEPEEEEERKLNQEATLSSSLGCEKI